jgi:hypothetical protein
MCVQHAWSNRILWYLESGPRALYAIWTSSKIYTNASSAALRGVVVDLLTMAGRRRKNQYPATLSISHSSKALYTRIINNKLKHGSESSKGLDRWFMCSWSHAEIWKRPNYMRRLSNPSKENLQASRWEAQRKRIEIKGLKGRYIHSSFNSLWRKKNRQVWKQVYECEYIIKFFFLLIKRVSLASFIHTKPKFTLYGVHHLINM